MSGAWVHSRWSEQEQGRGDKHRESPISIAEKDYGWIEGANA